MNSKRLRSESESSESNQETVTKKVCPNSPQQNNIDSNESIVQNESQSQTQQIRYRQHLLQNAKNQQEKGDDLFNQLLEGENQDSDEDSNNNNEENQKITITEKDIENNSKILKQVNEFLKQRSSQLIRNPSIYESIFNDHTLFTIKCSKSHIWDSSLKILEQYWCRRCELPYQKVKQYAKKLQGKVLSKCIKDTIDFECVKKHKFQLDFKNYSDHWCQVCYEEILNSFEMPNDSEYSLMIKQQSQKQAEEFIKNNSDYFNMAQDFEKISSVIYVNEIPENVYITYLKTLDKEALRKHKSKIYKNVHPDINRHPYARNAFLKLQSIFEKL